MTGAVGSVRRSADWTAMLTSIDLTFLQAHTSETQKMVNLPKASDDAEKKQEKEETDPIAMHGEDTGGKPHATEVSGPGDDKPDVVVN
ncbi:hypothetical protein QFC21_004392 [Naganishia friedmannii]|uniref:Uncharacterized protein n=1 Tax=Naganishia friedmannii TaxID=89922 RepID=A0ACC2VIC7_9TREE|nr:hypothetical protein QFC21_004392 [Naganishia friedmannii]